MTSTELDPDPQSLCGENETGKMSREQISCPTRSFQAFEYSGQRDLDPNQVECFLTTPNEVESNVKVEKFNTLLCQICKMSFEGATPKHGLLEHINSIHSFNVYDKGEICCVCNAVFYTSKAFKLHQDECKKDSESFNSVTSQPSNNTEGEINESHSENTENNITLNSEDGHDSLKETTDNPEALKEAAGLKSAKCTSSIMRECSAGRKELLNNSLKCYICSKIFRRTKDFISHITCIHENEFDEKDFDDLSYRCKKCATTFPNINLLRGHFFKKHMALIIYRCIICHITLKNKKSLRIHYNNFHAQKNKELHSCDECGKELTNSKALKAHIRLKHGQNKNRQGFQCRLCQQRFDTKDERKLHYGREHLGESPFICSDCGKGFSSKSGLYGHRQLHKTDQPSTCPYCEKIFNRRDSFHEHILIHVGPRHRCPHCPKEFVQRSNLVRHIRIHTGQKPYTCTFCDKRFSDKGACNSHIRVHTKEEQCTCPYCGQTFTKKQKLKYHIRKHTGEGLISCEICSKTFTNAFALKEHRAIHDRQTQTICVECGKAFNSAKYLQRHVALVHQDPQDSRIAIHCPLCEKTFCHQTKLKSHLVSHLGKKHLRCLICEKRYSSSKSIKNHLKQSHDLRPDQPEFKKSVCSDLESTKISVNSIQVTEGPCSPEVTRKDTVLTFLFEKGSNSFALTSEEGSARSKPIDDTFGTKWTSKFHDECLSYNGKLVPADADSENIELGERERMPNLKDTNITADVPLNSKSSNGKNTNEDQPLSIKIEDMINCGQSYKRNCETIRNSVSTNVTNEILYKNSHEIPGANSSAIIEDRIGVNDEKDDSKKETLAEALDVGCFQIVKKDLGLCKESFKEISRRRKQLRTPKKYVSPSEMSETVDDRLQVIMPKRERVEAIARSLKESSNLK